MAWRLAESLKTLRKQVDTLFPDRDKVSDGTIGDLRHKKTKSSHNPDSEGVVRAIDITHNPSKGIDCRLLLKTLLENKDKRLWYIIFDRKIYNRKDGFQPRHYAGKNAHKHHLHISVSDSSALYDNDAYWGLSFGSASPVEEIPTFKELTVGSKGTDVFKLQQRLHEYLFLKSSDIDGDFGRITRNAVILFQRSAKLNDDGIVGAKTWKALGL